MSCSTVKYDVFISFHCQHLSFFSYFIFNTYTPVCIPFFSFSRFFSLNTQTQKEKEEERERERKKVKSWTELEKVKELCFTWENINHRQRLWRKNTQWLNVYRETNQTILVFRFQFMIFKFVHWMSLLKSHFFLSFFLFSLFVCVCLCFILTGLFFPS